MGVKLEDLPLRVQAQVKAKLSVETVKAAAANIKKAEKTAAADRRNNDTDNFISNCLRYGLPAPVTEYLFAKESYGREWATDYFFTHPDTGRRVAVEVEGGAYTQGRHTRGGGFIEDMAKYNTYALLGIPLLRFTPDMLKDKPLHVCKIIAGVLNGRYTIGDMRFFIKELIPPPKKKKAKKI